MRTIAVLIGILAVTSFTVLPAQAPTFQVAGPAVPGAIVSLNLAGATPGGFAVAAFGFALGQTSVGPYATLGLLPAGYLALGTVSPQGSLFTGIQLPTRLPPTVCGLSVFFQAAVIHPHDAAVGDPIRVDLSAVQSIVIEYEWTDPLAVGDDGVSK